MEHLSRKLKNLSNAEKRDANNSSNGMTTKAKWLKN